MQSGSRSTPLPKTGPRRILRGGVANTRCAVRQGEPVVHRKHTAAQPIDVTGTWGTFDARFPYTTATSGTGKVLVFEISPKGGTRINEVDVPLTVAL